MAGSIIKDGDRYLLYYCGWQRMTAVPYNWAIGCAVSYDGKTFQRLLEAQFWELRLKNLISGHVPSFIVCPKIIGKCIISRASDGCETQIKRSSRNT